MPALSALWSPLGSASRVFNGTSDKINVGNVAALQTPVFPFFVGLWVMGTSGSATNSAGFGTLQSSPGSWGWTFKAVQNFAGHPPGLTIFGATPTDAGAANIGMIPTGQWVFLVANWNATTQFYYLWDGAVLKTDTVSYTGTMNVPTTSTFIGADNFGGGADFFQGRIAHVMAVSNFLATKNQVIAIAKGSWDIATFGGGTLEGYWPLWGSSPEVDLSGKARHGVLSGTGIAPGPPLLSSEFRRSPQSEWFVPITPPPPSAKFAFSDTMMPQYQVRMTRVLI